MNGHPRDQAKVSVHCRWPPIRGNLTLKCVGRGIDNVAYKAGGRSRRRSHKAGTTVDGSYPTQRNVIKNLVHANNHHQIGLQNYTILCRPYRATITIGNKQMEEV